MNTFNESNSVANARRTLSAWATRAKDWWQELELGLWFHDKIRTPISVLLFPRQRWLTREIPRHFTDLSHLIPHLNFTMLINFVEGEDGLKVLREQVEATYAEMDPEAAKERRAFFRAACVDLDAAYTWARTRDDEACAIQDDLNTAFLDDVDSAERMQALEIFERRQERHRLTDLRHLQSIMQHYPVMWT